MINDHTIETDRFAEEDEGCCEGLRERECETNFQLRDFVCVKCERSELFIRNLAGKIISLYFFNISIFGEFEFWIQLSYKALDIIKFKLVTFSVCSWKNDIVWFEYVLREISNLIIKEFYTD